VVLDGLHSGPLALPALVITAVHETGATAARRFEPVIYEEVESAATARPVLDRMLAGVRAGHIQAVAVWALDRLHRSMTGAVKTVLTLDGLGVQVPSVREDGSTRAARCVPAPCHDPRLGREVQRARLIERTTPVSSAARRQRKRLGRPPASAVLLYTELVESGIPVAGTARNRGSLLVDIEAAYPSITGKQTHLQSHATPEPNRLGGIRVIASILKKGYLPTELPPSFSTTALANAATDVACPPALKDVKTYAKLCRHSLLRTGSLRRGLAIVNPIPFVTLAEVVAKGWLDLRAKIRTSEYSKSRPVLGKAASPRAFMRLYDFAHLAKLRAQARAARRHVAWTDISQFYPSIYTHSIPWALTSKTKAKAAKHAKNLGNSLDTALRNCQDQQTVGIPVGPDTSLVIGELVLAAAEQTVFKKVGDIRGFRYVDDYEFGLESSAQVDDVLSALQNALTVYELSLNPKKTRDMPLPASLESEWVADLRQFTFHAGKRQASDLITYWDKVGKHSSRNPDDPIVKYGVATLSRQPIERVNFKLYCSLLYQAGSVEPSSLPAVLASLQTYRAAGYRIEEDELGAFLSGIVSRHAPLGHGSEVAWALWGALAFGMPLTVAAQAAVKGMPDSVVAVLALDCVQAKLTTTVSPADWKHYFTADEMLGEQWLLAYEAAAQGWVSDAHARAHPAFAYLLDAGVKFYIPPAAAKAAPPTPALMKAIAAMQAHTVAAGGGGGNLSP
jgi:hypothetical protein